MHNNEIRFITNALLDQGIVVERLSSGTMWVLRDFDGTPVGLVPTDGDADDWHRVLMALKRSGRIIWPPDW